MRLNEKGGIGYTHSGYAVPPPPDGLPDGLRFDPPPPPPPPPDWASQKSDDPPERSQYRIRWAWVQGPWNGTRRMCIAEKRYSFFGLFRFWGSIWNGDINWRYTEAEAERDIAEDQVPLPPTRSVDVAH